MPMRGPFISAVSLAFVGTALLAHPRAQSSVASPAEASIPEETRQTLNRYCVSCHNRRTNAAELALDTLAGQSLADHTAEWERVVRKLRARAMPPAGAARPDEATYERLATSLADAIDRRAAVRPDPGRTDTLRRLNRTQYRNAIRDLLDLDVEVTELLPADESSFGFDNVSVGSLSPTLMERYLAAAQKVSRLAVGSPVRTPTSRVVLVPPDLTQEDHLEGLPLGTRGGTIVAHAFPRDGEYEIQVRLARNRNENVEGLTEPHEMEILLDGQRAQTFTITPNRNRLGQYYADEAVDRGLQVTLRVTAGPHDVAATFRRKNLALLETERQPYQAHFNADRHPRVQPGVHSISIVGPFGDTAVGETPSRRRIFSCHPAGAGEGRTTLRSASAGSARPAPLDSAVGADECASRILRSLARRAYRRPVTAADVRVPLDFYKRASAESGFEGGIEMALRAILASTEFLFRVERDPVDAVAGGAYRVSDLELASRLSFFLWSSIPDDELLDKAAAGALRQPAELDKQVRRMLADPRAASLVSNFAVQWLRLQNLSAVSPDPRQFADFDHNLRQAFRQETELFVSSIIDEDRGVMDLLTANYTFLNERLAKHYGVPHVYGDRFRRVTLPDGGPRSGLLGHGSILTLTSYATRTSPVSRGKWILENIIGTPPPPPPPNVPALPEDRSMAKPATMRERMVQHRANAVCASCHQLMDPLGLSMEHFDAIGRWRDRGDEGLAIDATGRLFGDAPFDGVAGLRRALVERPNVFATTVTEKLMTYALGRGLEASDAPAVRRITREAASDHYKFSSLVRGVIASVPFQMRRAGASDSPKPERTANR